jgi:RND superfamily putative drug exporter
MAGTGAVVTSAGLVFAATMATFAISPLRVMGQVGTTIALGLLFDTLIVRSFMMPSVAALMGRWFWWPQRVRTRPASEMLRPYGSRSAVRAYMLPKVDTEAQGSSGESPESESTDRFRVGTPHY